MPGLTVTGHADAPVEDVWKLLFDPSRFPEWWDGFDTVRPDGPGAFTWWPTGHPDYPMPQRMHTDEAGGRVTISCQVRDVSFVWRLAADGEGTAVEVRAELAASEAHREAGVRAMLATSMRSLTVLATDTAQK
ncbi:MAG: SRPBCC family protein [Actinomycetota bacterium]|nr:SRPBCC family protein [Actinomycetota bacterium]